MSLDTRGPRLSEMAVVVGVACVLARITVGTGASRGLGALVEGACWVSECESTKDGVSYPRRFTARAGVGPDMALQVASDVKVFVAHMALVRFLRSWSKESFHKKESGSERDEKVWSLYKVAKLQRKLTSPECVNEWVCN